MPIETSAGSPAGSPVDSAAVAPLVLHYRLPSGLQISDTGVGSLQWPEGQGPFGQQQVLTPNPHIATVRCQSAAMSAQECDAVIAMGAAQPHVSREGPQAQTCRASHISWIMPDEGNAWLFHKVGALFAQANLAYGFELTGLVDALQFIEYGPGDWFNWHLDMGHDETSLRKLSLTLQLSGSGDYDGGDLEFVGLPTGDQARERGAATFYPSYLGHRVTAVTHGVRRALVAWASGTPFR